jgi:hypothetical protein
VDKGRENRLTREYMNPTTDERKTPPQEQPNHPSKGTQKPMNLTDDFTQVTIPPIEEATADAPWRRGAGNSDGSQRGGMRHA